MRARGAKSGSGTRGTHADARRRSPRHEEATGVPSGSPSGGLQGRQRGRGVLTYRTSPSSQPEIIFRSVSACMQCTYVQADSGSTRAAACGTPSQHDAVETPRAREYLHGDRRPVESLQQRSESRPRRKGAAVKGVAPANGLSAHRCEVPLERVQRADGRRPYGRRLVGSP